MALDVALKSGWSAPAKDHPDLIDLKWLITKITVYLSYDLLDRTNTQTHRPHVHALLARGMRESDLKLFEPFLFLEEGNGAIGIIKIVDDAINAEMSKTELGRSFLASWNAKEPIPEENAVAFYEKLYQIEHKVERSVFIAFLETLPLNLRHIVLGYALELEMKNYLTVKAAPLNSKQKQDMLIDLMRKRGMLL